MEHPGTLLRLVLVSAAGYAVLAVMSLGDWPFLVWGFLFRPHTPPFVSDHGCSLETVSFLWGGGGYLVDVGVLLCISFAVAKLAARWHVGPEKRRRAVAAIVGGLAVFHWLLFAWIVARC